MITTDLKDFLGYNFIRFALGCHIPLSPDGTRRFPVRTNGSAEMRVDSPVSPPGNEIISAFTLGFFTGSGVKRAQ